MTLPYKEGDVFAVPLRSHGHALGLVARAPKQGKILLGYFFRYKGDVLPEVGPVSHLTPEDSVLAVRFGDLSLYKKEWPIVGRIKDWDRMKWPMPSFIRRDPLVKDRAWRIRYSDDDPTKQLPKEPWPASDVTLEDDGLLGAGAVEIALTKLIR